MSLIDRTGTAKRVRALVSANDGGDTATVARRLHVTESALRSTIDELAPYPTVEVLVGIIREYGVDPTWLLTGTYDPETHRKSLMSTSATHRTVQRAFVDGPGRISGPRDISDTPGEAPESSDRF